jgi:hypothetical protein
LLAAAAKVLADGAAVGNCSAPKNFPDPPTRIEDFGRTANPELLQLASKSAKNAAAMGKNRAIMSSERVKRKC